MELNNYKETDLDVVEEGSSQGERAEVPPSGDPSGERRSAAGLEVNRPIWESLFHR